MKTPTRTSGGKPIQRQQAKPHKPVTFDPPPRLAADGVTVKPKSGQLPKELQLDEPPAPIVKPGTMREPISFDEVPLPAAIKGGKPLPAVESDAAAQIRAKMAAKKAAEQPKPPVDAIPETVMRPRSAPPASPQPKPATAQRPKTEPAPTAFKPAIQATASAIFVRETAAPPGYTRQLLPSNGVPYAPEAFVRPLDVPDLLSIIPGLDRLQKGDAGGLTQVLDGLNNCLTQDIRDLTESDLRFLMYWWKINSFPRSPFTVYWTSRYGNRNETVVVNTNQLEVIRLTGMTPAEYVGYLERGVRIPTVRDTEAMQQMPRLDAASEFLVQRAQYVHLTPEDEAELVDENGQPLGWFPARMEKIKRSGMEYLADISDFSKKIEHGIVENVEAADKYFVPEKAVEHLRFVANSFREVINENDKSFNPEVVLDMIDKAKEVDDEADDIEKKLAAVKNNEEGAEAPQPRKEVVRLSLTLADFFPQI